MLNVQSLKAAIEGPSSAKASEGKKEILKGIDLEVKPGEIHVLMGPNGSGKSTLAQVLMGSPGYKVHPTSLCRAELRGASSSRIIFDGKDISKLTPDKRAKLGIFLAFQHPVEIPGVSMFNVLRKAKGIGLSGNQVTRQSGIRNSPKTNGEGKFNAVEFRQELVKYASDLKLSSDFLRRSLNEGFSGGEKKRSEILQMMALSPKLVILDEIDSGLDVDALKIVASMINRFTKDNPRSSVLLITHYARILKFLKPDFVHVMVDGKIVKSGKLELAKLVEEKGYQNFQKSTDYSPRSTAVVSSR